MKTRTSIKGGGIATRNHNESIRVHSNLTRDDRRNRKDGDMYGTKVMSIHIIHKSWSL